MLLHDDVVAERKAEARALPGGLGREEWVEHFFSDLRRYSGPVVAYPNLHVIPEASRRGGESWFISPIGASFRFIVA